MDIKQKADEILFAQQEENATILEIFKTGSQLFIENPHDLDFIIVCDGFTQRRRKVFFEEDGLHYDLIFIDKKAVAAQLNFSDDSYIHYKIKLYNYFYALKETVFGGYDDGWDIFEQEESYFEYIKKHYAEGVGKLTVKWKVGKLFVHYYVILKMYINGSTEITSEMMEDIQILYSRTEAATPIIEWIVGLIES